MKHRIWYLLAILFAWTACEEQNDTWDPYYNWEARNAAWFEQVADSARTAIAKAKAIHGQQWEDHCDWRMIKSYMKSADVQGPLTDSICVHILKRGAGTYKPCYTDTVRINFRGWLMETEYENENGKKETSPSVFTQSYYGSYNPQTAAPQTVIVSSFVEGFSTALQYMVEGDDWLVYIPQNMAYGEEESSTIPAYSTLLFRLSVVGVYESGSGMPQWK